MDYRDDYDRGFCQGVQKVYEKLNSNRYKYTLRPNGNPDLYLSGYTDAVKDLIDLMEGEGIEVKDE